MRRAVRHWHRGLVGEPSRVVCYPRGVSTRLNLAGEKRNVKTAIEISTQATMVEMDLSSGHNSFATTVVWRHEIRLSIEEADDLISQLTAAKMNAEKNREWCRQNDVTKGSPKQSAVQEWNEFIAGCQILPEGSSPAGE